MYIIYIFDIFNIYFFQCSELGWPINFGVKSCTIVSDQGLGHKLYIISRNMSFLHISVAMDPTSSISPHSCCNIEVSQEPLKTYYDQRCLQCTLPIRMSRFTAEIKYLLNIIILLGHENSRDYLHTHRVLNVY